MKRRTLLRGLGALGAGAAGAGCTRNNREVPVTAPAGPDGAREPDGGSGDDGNGESGGSDEDTGTPQPFRVPEFDAVAGESDELVVTVTVENALERSHTAQLVVSVNAGGEEYTERRVVSLDGGASETYRLPMPVQYEAFSGGGLDIGFEPGTPETPFPTATPSATTPPNATEADGTSDTAETNADASD